MILLNTKMSTDSPFLNFHHKSTLKVEVKHKKMFCKPVWNTFIRWLFPNYFVSFTKYIYGANKSKNKFCHVNSHNDLFGN
jgi:hypothetical protein